MKRFILSLSAVAIILVMAVSSSKDKVNDVLPTLGNADLNVHTLPEVGSQIYTTHIL